MILENTVGLFTTLTLTAGIGYLTYRGFCQGAAEIKNGGCCGGCGSGSCPCGGCCDKQKSGKNDKSDESDSEKC